MRTRRIVIITLAVSGLFFAANILAFVASGSRAVLSQALYAITDIVGGVMIYWGMRASQEPPTLVHPFGRGKERFFWAFTAGLVTFSLTGFLVLAYGLGQMINPATIHNVNYALVVVAATLGSSTLTLLLVLEELRKERVSIKALLSSDRQEMKILLVQDALGVVGALVAITGIYVVFATGNARFDGYAATTVGALLLGTGIAFAAEARVLLVGKAVSMNDTKHILSIVERYPFIRGVVGMQSMLLGPEEILVALRVNFMDGLTTDDIEMHIDQLRRFVMGECPSVHFLVIEPVAENVADSSLMIGNVPT